MENFGELKGDYISSDGRTIKIREVGKYNYEFDVFGKLYKTWATPLHPSGNQIFYQLDGDFGDRSFQVVFHSTETKFDASNLGVNDLAGIFTKTQ